MPRKELEKTESCTSTTSIPFSHRLVLLLLPSTCTGRICSRGEQQQQGPEAAAAAAGTRSTGRAVAASTPAMTTAETARPTMPTAPSSIADDFDSDSDSLQGTTAVVKGNAVGIDSKSRLGQTTTTPDPATKDDGGDLPSATTAMDVDFHSNLSPAQPTIVAASGTAANTDFDSYAFSVQTAGVVVTGTAAVVDFDSDSSPAKPPVVVATGTAADVDFDSDSSAATPVPAAAADTVGVNFDSDSQPPAEANGAADNGGVEELLRLASEVDEEGERGISSTTSCPANRSSVHDPGPKPLQQGGHAEPGSGDAVAASPHKRRRCGIVCLGGTASDLGFCASSLSQR